MGGGAKWIAALAWLAAADPAQAVCNTAGSYVAASGDVVRNPRCHGAGDEGATYRCGDGSFSHAEQRRGACSRHDGIAQDLTGASQ